MTGEKRNKMKNWKKINNGSGGGSNNTSNNTDDNDFHVDNFHKDSRWKNAEY